MAQFIFSAADRGQLRYSAPYAGGSKLPHKPAEITADKVKLQWPTEPFLLLPGQDVSSANDLVTVLWGESTGAESHM